MQALSVPQTLLLPFGCSRAVRRRAWAVLLTLFLALAAFMHVAHTHEADAPATYKFCSFCTTLDRGGAPPPAITVAIPFLTPAAAATVVEIAGPLGTTTRTPRQSRAPPALQA
jgi:hypothetical protein